MSADHEEEWASSEVACSEPPWGLRQAHGLVTCHGALVLVGGFSSDKGSSNDVWRSTNGGQVSAGVLNGLLYNEIIV